MKFFAAGLLLLALLANAQLAADEAILRYLNQGEDYSTIEIVYQFPGAGERTNVLVVVREAPVFVVSGDGELIEDEETILSVSRDYVESRGPGVVVASAESIAASIIEETQRRKGKSIIRETSASAVAEVASAKDALQTAREALPDADFSVAEQELNYYEAQARDMGRAFTLEEVRVLNHSFYTEYRGIARFASLLNQSFSFLSQAAENTRQARELLDTRKVQVGRDDPSVLANEAELQEIEALLGEEIEKIQSVAEPDPEAARGLAQRSAALLRGIRGITVSGFDLVSIALGIFTILIIIGGVILYFKKLRKKQEKEEHPPEPGLV